MIAYSVLMSVYAKERPEYLKAAIDSMLSQTEKPSEFVLVKDGPLTPELESVIAGYSESPLFRTLALEKNCGLGEALRLGVLACKNEFIARMDSDDISLPARLEKELSVFAQNPEIDVVGCFEGEFWDHPEKPFATHKVPESHEEIFRFMKLRCGLLHPTVVFKKSAVLKAGNYRSSYLLEDYDLFVRMLQSGAKTQNVPEALYLLRVNPALFSRRGGLKYAGTLFRFRLGLWRSKFISFGQFLVSGLGHSAVCLFPNRLRILFYKLFLR